MQRLNHISFVRVAAMLMVIAFHSLCFYTPNWKEFPHENQDAYYYLSWMLDGIDMSAFVFISGYLFGYHYYKGRYDDIKKFISSKAQRLLLPLVVWITIQHFILPGIARIGVGNYDFLHLWFLLMLFEIFVLAICFIDKINSLSLSKLIYFEIVLIVAGFVFGLKPTRLLSCFCFYNTVVYMPIFFAGYMITRLRNNEKIEVKLLSHFITLYGKLVNGGGEKIYDIHWNCYTFSHFLFL